MERKSCDPGQAQALETWHKSTQCSRATRHHRIWLFSQYSWHLEDELDPTGFIIQPLISATLVRSGGGWYNQILLYLDKESMAVTDPVFFWLLTWRDVCRIHARRQGPRGYLHQVGRFRQGGARLRADGPLVGRLEPRLQSRLESHRHRVQGRHLAPLQHQQCAAGFFSFSFPRTGLLCVDAFYPVLPSFT